MTYPRTDTDTTNQFRQSSVPEFVFVYNHTADYTEVRFEDVTIKVPQSDIELIKDANFTLKDG